MFTLHIPTKPRYDGRSVQVADKFNRQSIGVDFAYHEGDFEIYLMLDRPGDMSGELIALPFSREALINIASFIETFLSIPENEAEGRNGEIS